MKTSITARFNDISSPQPRSDLDHKVPKVFSRRQLATNLLGAAMLLKGPFLGGDPATAAPLSAADRANLTPYQRGQQLEYGLLNDRIRGCDSVAQPSCVSTSSLSSLYSPPWVATAESPDAAIKEFDKGLKAIAPGTQLMETKATSDGLYCQYKVPSGGDYDIVEVLVTKQPAPYDEDLLVTYRSQATTVKYIWPITQPITDLGAQRKRMSTLRKNLRWLIQGCDQLECYQE